ncbi:MAG TPA: hypothetical protein VMT63_05730 [Bacteroidales bacterium]|nr:hypothetical protein [Bacteroidales bacterium]
MNTEADIKRSSLKILRELALSYNRKRYPHTPEYARSCKPYSDKTANGLTTCILDFLKFSGWQGERISNTGRYLDNSKVVTDTLGNKRRIGSGKWIRGSGVKGTADISATIRGKSVKIEVKMKDRQSPDQKNYQAAIEKAGGLYWLVRSFDDFMNFYKTLCNE